MADDKKHMCEWKKTEKDFDAFRKVVRKPRYACKRCGRVADVKKRLCKPLSLDG